MKCWGWSEYELEIRNYELEIRNYELGIRNYELGIRNYELGISRLQLDVMYVFYGVCRLPWNAANLAASAEA
jgi:hypothetical protein